METLYLIFTSLMLLSGAHGEPCVSVIDSWEKTDSYFADNPNGVAVRVNTSHGAIVEHVVYSMGVKSQVIKIPTNFGSRDPAIFQKALDDARCPIVNISLDSRQLLHWAMRNDIVFPKGKKYIIALGNYTNASNYFIGTYTRHLDYRFVNAYDVTFVASSSLIGCDTIKLSHPCLTRDGVHFYKGKDHYGSSFAAPQVAAEAALALLLQDDWTWTWTK